MSRQLLLPSFAALFICFSSTSLADSPTPSHAALVADLDQIFTAIREDYAYPHVNQLNEAAVRARLAADIDAMQVTDDLVRVGKRALYELTDNHANLGPSLATSAVVAPTGTDLWFTLAGDSLVIGDVKRRSAAFKAGIRPGDVLAAVDGKPVADAVAGFWGQPYEALSDKKKLFAANILAGGIRYQGRTLTISHEGTERVLSLGDTYHALDDLKADGPLATDRLEGNIGYIAIMNGLGDMATAEAFDTALDGLMDTKGLIIDLRNCPSGGNSWVAKAMLGRFVDHEMPYQRHERPSEFREVGIRHIWLEYVAPRGAKPYTAPVVILSGHWTGSMGEGLTMGFDAIGAKATVGSEMAHLLGAIENIDLDHSGLTLQLPTETLFHIDGTPRERFRPGHFMEAADTASDGSDPALRAALNILK